MKLSPELSKLIKEDFKEQFIEFSDEETNKYLDRCIGLAACLHGGEYKNDDKQTFLYLTAHLLHQRVASAASINAAAGTPAKSVASVSVEGVSESYFEPFRKSAHMLFFETTSYGQVYLRLISRSANSARWV